MRYIFICLLLLQFQLISSTSNHYRFRLYLKDKPTNWQEETDTLSFLSKKAIERRNEQEVEIDNTDLPLSPLYKQKIQEEGAQIVVESKWFNTLVVQLADSNHISKLQKFDFIDSIRFVWRGKPLIEEDEMRPRLKPNNNRIDSVAHNWFGSTSKQFEVHNAQSMLKAGFRGRGIDVAIIDAGYTNVDVIPLFKNSYIANFKNFVPRGNLFASSDHGTKVFSTIATNEPYVMMGSAPEASYYLLRSEDEKSEFPVEEDYWVAAIEYADSIGVKLVNTSLGYNTFDDESLSYQHAHLTGSNSLISRAVDMAFDKGMLIVGSAGNEGNKLWQKITMPGDSKKMLTVGAIAIDSTLAPFSSVGPTADGRIKPDFVSVGKQTVALTQQGIEKPLNGTSFSSPFLTGLIGSLWSINPKLNRHQLIEIVRESSHQFHTPDSLFGFGIPNFDIASQKVMETLPPQSGDLKLDVIDITQQEDNILCFILTDKEFPSRTYSLRVVTQRGDLLLSKKFETRAIDFSLTEELKQENNYLYIIVQTPYEQETIRYTINNQYPTWSKIHSRYSN